MEQKHLMVIFIGLMILGVGVMFYSQFQSSPDDQPLESLPPVNTSQELGTNQQQTNNQSEPIELANPSPPQSLNPSRKSYHSPPPDLPSAELNQKKAVITTSKGEIEIELFPDAVRATSNFIFLVREGFYNGLTFHRVEPGFVIQGGDPNGDGTGGPGYTNREPKILNDGKYQKGIVAYAKRSDEPSGTFGSQFFIMLDDAPLPADYAIFARVIRGQEVVAKIRRGDRIEEIKIEG